MGASGGLLLSNFSMPTTYHGSITVSLSKADDNACAPAVPTLSSDFAWSSVICIVCWLWHICSAYGSCCCNRRVWISRTPVIVVMRDRRALQSTMTRLHLAVRQCSILACIPPPSLGARRHATQDGDGPHCMKTCWLGLCSQNWCARRRLWRHSQATFGTPPDLLSPHATLRMHSTWRCLMCLGGGSATRNRCQHGPKNGPTWRLWRGFIFVV